MIKISEFPETISLNDVDLIEISKDSSGSYGTYNIKLSDLRNTLGTAGHTIQSHTDTDATGVQLNTLTDGSNADLLHSHNTAHDIQSHSDTDATGAELDTLTDGSNADSLHSHDTDHNIQSHSDTDATGAELDTLTDGSNADSLHSHDTEHEIDEHHIDSVVPESNLELLTDGSDANSMHIHSLASINYTASIQPGTIIGIPYSIIPPGWLECDGSSLDKVIYINLYNGLKNSGSKCIYGEDVSNFFIPDYRGRFLRCIANGSVNDPDRDSRSDRGDGTTGDAVGTYQLDQFKSHYHEYSLTIAWKDEAEGGEVVPFFDFSDPRDFYYDTTAYGGNETRPTNIALKYIIKI